MKKFFKEFGEEFIEWLYFPAFIIIAMVSVIIVLL
jgi:hypothetical protein